MSDGMDIPPHLQRHAYSRAQLLAYYDRIRLPEIHRNEPGPTSARIAQDPEQGLAFLTALHTHHLTNIPFENLDLHYSREHAIYIDPPHLFTKIVENARGRGGYCMESNGLFGTVLRSLGFDVYPTGARINRAIDPGMENDPHFYKGWNHMIHIVSIGPKRYMVDVGNGPTNPTAPIALDDSSASPVANISPQTRRLRRSVIPDTTRKTMADQALWCYEVQHQPAQQSPWIPVHCFSELEFLPSDFQIINFYSSQYPQSIFRRNLNISKHLLRNGEFFGVVTCDGKQLKRREHGIKTLNIEFKTEEERTTALQEHMGIVLLPAEKAAIENYPTQIVSLYEV